MPTVPEDTVRVVQLSVVKVATFGVVPMTGGTAHVEPCRVEELRLATWVEDVTVMEVKA